MAESTPEMPATAPPPPPPSPRGRRWGKRIGWALAILFGPLALVALFLATPLGKRFIADQIAAVAPASGLRFEVGRIEGDIYSQAVLRQVTVSDPKGAFLTIPEVRLDWRPLNWLWSGLDIREVTARRGRLARIPELLPGDPDAPLLPDFDIRVDKLAIEDLVIAKGVATAQDERANLTAQVDIRKGRALIDAKARLGRADRFTLLLDAEPDGDRFDLAGDALAPAGGVIAGLAGLEGGYSGRILGDGTWARWRGVALARRVDAGETPPVAAFQVVNDAGRYGVIGQLRAGLGPETLAGRAAGDVLSLAASFTLADSVVEGRLAAVSSALDWRAAGSANLADKQVDGARVKLALRDPDLFGEALRIEGGALTASLSGAFDDLAIKHEIAVTRLAASGVVASGLAQSGSARFEGGVLRVPLALTAERVVTGNPQADPRLIRGRITGLLTYDTARQWLAANRAEVSFPGLAATLSLEGNIPAGAYAIAGPVTAERLKVDGLGDLTANAKILAKFGPAVPWSLRANLAGVVSRIGNATIVNLAGDSVRFKGELGMGQGQPIILRNTTVTAPRLTARLDSKVVPGSGGTRTAIAGSGRQAQYGPFTIDAELAADGPRGTLVLADPYPAAGLKDVRIALAPRAEGFGLEVEGDSLLGRFDGMLGLFLPENAPTRIAIDRLQVYRTNVTGEVLLEDAGPRGDLRLVGGGVNGTLAFRSQEAGAIGFAVDLAARNATFGGATPISITRADLVATGRYADGSTSVDADVTAAGFEYGGLSLASLTAKASLTNGRGKVTGNVAGRRADRFALNFDADVAPGRIAAVARGQYGGAEITMPRRAVLTSRDGEPGWNLAPTQLGFGGGFAIASGNFGGGTTALELKLSKMPLRLLDLAGADLGLGGRLTGVIDYRQTGRAPPSASARGKIERFSRAGLVLSSKPINVIGVVDLAPQRLTAALRLFEGEARRGDVALRIGGLPEDGAITERLNRGRLDARLAFEGAAETLWRLAAVEAFDLAGPVRIAATATGTLADPRITGTVASDDLTVESALTGTRITKVNARGRFAGSRLELVRFAGTTAGSGTISGSGTVDLAGIGAGRGPGLDLRAAAKGARLLDGNGLEATITGPLRIVSNGLGGTIAGRVTLDRARWALGNADEDRALPRIATREINGEDGRGRTQVSARDAAWRYLVNASAPSRVMVEGLGLESEWGIDIALRGTVDDPRIGGTARLVRGDYTFAGTRFDLTRGRILFDVNEPINPRLDVLAETAKNGTNVDIAITGNALSPAITFSSDPELPEEEILARLLFGGSVTSLSATDAVQLAAALAALQGGGGGLDPIGSLRRSIGLDQLRIVSADPLTGRQTGIAIGKNITRQIYVELVTDGRGYSATQVEYRITSWLALLGTVSTIGRDSVLVQVSRDY
ncbi:translocation/assembly module TamB domain-containing protein [Erythrobacter sp. BLCC-B19]|uniref:translocation/assembly module TamB domain-containing protein n=1 Tax=Erythrobacter sp. BLCC-B19 TaxID=3025315 RepID=UPI00236025B3|nr:translocation/assembly module TamB domain-containing protein [Erythrobacter sp. BLCC-B19]WDA39920.1 translocation/assembly module TamB domain-containing protein [Erythrobacter sp. BLCC-B19]